MVEIGKRPILWNILKIYSSYGINDLIVCCGYNGYMMKEYFDNYFLHTSYVTFHMDINHMEIHKQNAEPWKVMLVDTCEATSRVGAWRVCANISPTPFASPMEPVWQMST